MQLDQYYAEQAIPSFVINSLNISSVFHVTPGQKNCVGVWYPSFVPENSLILNYVKCLLCSGLMLREPDQIQICGRERCRAAREMKQQAAMAIVFHRREEEVKLPDLARWNERQNFLEARERAKKLEAYQARLVEERKQKKEDKSSLEIEVLQLVAEDFTYRDVAEKLGIRAFTCRQYVYRLCRRWNVGSKLEAISMGIEKGLIKITSEQLEIVQSKKERRGRRMLIRPEKPFVRKPPVRLERDAYGLTDRDKQILVLLSEGFTRREIAIKLDTTTQSAKNMCREIFDVLDVSNAIQAVLVATRKGIIKIDGLTPIPVQEQVAS